MRGVRLELPDREGPDQFGEFADDDGDDHSRYRCAHGGSPSRQPSCTHHRKDPSQEDRYDSQGHGLKIPEDSGGEQNCRHHPSGPEPRFAQHVEGGQAPERGRHVERPAEEEVREEASRKS